MVREDTGVLACQTGMALGVSEEHTERPPLSASGPSPSFSGLELKVAGLGPFRVVETAQLVRPTQGLWPTGLTFSTVVRPG